MQIIAPVTNGDLLGPVQRMRYKLEVYDEIHYRTDFLAGWSFRKRIDIQTAYLDANLVDFPLYVSIVADADIGAECLATGYDIRFTASDGTSLLPYERESWSGGGGVAVTADFWVQASLSTSGTHIWCYYGKAGAVDGEDAEAVWDTGFKAVYHMDDDTTSSFLDSTAYGNDATKSAANEPIEADGKIGKGQSFDGTFVPVTVPPEGGVYTYMTLSAWVDCDTPATFYGIFESTNAPYANLRIDPTAIYMRIDGGGIRSLPRMLSPLASMGRVGDT